MVSLCVNSNGLFAASVMPPFKRHLMCFRAGLAHASSRMSQPNDTIFAVLNAQTSRYQTSHGIQTYAFL
jgi:hypothetical protein